MTITITYARVVVRIEDPTNSPPINSFSWVLTHLASSPLARVKTLPDPNLISPHSWTAHMILNNSHQQPGANRYNQKSTPQTTTTLSSPEPVLTVCAIAPSSSSSPSGSLIVSNVGSQTQHNILPYLFLSRARFAIRSSSTCLLLFS